MEAVPLERRGATGGDAELPRRLRTRRRLCPVEPGAERQQPRLEARKRVEAALEARHVAPKPAVVSGLGPMALRTGGCARPSPTSGPSRASAATSGSTC